MQMYLQVFSQKHNTMLQESRENFLRKTVFCSTPAAKPCIWITNMFAVITDMMETRTI